MKCCERVTVVGGGVSGTNLALLAKKIGHPVFVSEKDKLSPERKDLLANAGIPWEEGHSERALQADLMLLSSGIPPYAPLVLAAQKQGITVIGEVDFVAPHLRGKTIGVTGSNGKSTTTALLGHLLAACDLKVAVAGNIGNPLADFAFTPYDYIVIELSSFQLHWSKAFHADLAIVTNLRPDHLNWHGSAASYFCSKGHLVELKKPSAWLISQAEALNLLPPCDLERATFTVHSEREGVDLPNRIILGERTVLLERGGKRAELFAFRDLAILGHHNVENAAMAMAAVALLGEDVSRARGALASFKGLPHRCEEVARKGGVLFVNDSKGTNVAAAVTALQSLNGKKIVILGGRGKGESYELLAKAVAEEAKAAVLLGEEREEIAKALRGVGFTAFCLVSDMEEAVKYAYNIARPGDVVLLSPACTSWDMYSNFEERGNHFKRLVSELA
jgi:UDP-N-acetylmuramoylalanine--D-glutamate ligase